MTSVRVALTLVVGLWLSASTLAAQAAAGSGEDLYAKNCRSCHGMRGTPPKALAKQMSIPALDATYFSTRSNDSLVHVMKRGGKIMKGFDGKLTAAEMAAVADYMKKAFSSAPAKPGQ